MAKNCKRLIFEYWLVQSGCSFGLKLKNCILWWFFRKHGHFWGWRDGGFFFCFFKILLFQKLLLRFNNKNISIYHISNDFYNFPRGGTKTPKKSKFWTLGGFPLVSFHWISKKIRIWATFTYIYNISYRSDKIRNLVWPPTPPPPAHSLFKYKPVFVWNF